MTLPLPHAEPLSVVAASPILPAPSLSGVVRLSHLGVIRASGEDAASFLQGQLTQDVTSMSLTEAHLAAFCNAKGRMQASFVVFKRQNDEGAPDILMVCSQDLLAQTLKRLSMFVMRAKVKLSDASADFSLFGLCGEVADAFFATDSGAARAHIYWSKRDIDTQNDIVLYPGGGGGGGVSRALWCAPSGTAAPAGPQLAISVWQYLEVESGIAMITLPIFEAFVPQMLNYESVGGVSFKKGCYPGQEVVARSQFRGTLKRRAYVMQTGGEAGKNEAGKNEAGKHEAGQRDAVQTSEAPFVGQAVFHASDAEQPCGTVAACAVRPLGGFALVVSMQTAAAAGLDAADTRLHGSPLRLGSSTGTALYMQSLPYPLLEDI